jgi:hypothetical protein
VPRAAIDSKLLIILKIPGNLPKNTISTPVLASLLANTSIKYFAGFASCKPRYGGLHHSLICFLLGAFNPFAPRLFTYYTVELGKLFDSNTNLLCNFAKGPWPAAAFNFGPFTITFPHTAPGNLFRMVHHLIPRPLRPTKRRPLCFMGPGSHRLASRVNHPHPLGGNLIFQYGCPTRPNVLFIYSLRCWRALRLGEERVLAFMARATEDELRRRELYVPLPPAPAIVQRVFPGSSVDLRPRALVQPTPTTLHRTCRRRPLRSYVSIRPVRGAGWGADRAVGGRS